MTAILLLLLSCGKSNEKEKESIIKKDSRKEKIVQTEKGKKTEDDSLELEKVLSDALKISEQNSNKYKLKKKYTVSSGLEVELNLDNHFAKDLQHLIIHRYGVYGVYIDIYSKVDRKFEKVISYELETITYRGDTIRDINGDGLKDFVVEWYGASGLNLKAFSIVYLLKQDKKTFSEQFNFINPTFSPQEKIIRGVCYGPSGETDIYKEKWNGEKTEIIEFVSYEKDKKGKKTGKIIVTKENSDENKKVIKRLNSVPDEYTKIYGYDWFTGKGYE
jgi:hypothetical protein